MTDITVVWLSKDDLLAALHASGEEVITKTRGLPPSAFARTCYAEGWTGHDVLAHIASIEWTYPRLIDIARRADDRPPSGAAGVADSPSSVQSAPARIDDYNARQVAKRAGASIDELLEEFARNRAATIVAVAAVDERLLAVEIDSAGGSVTGPLSGVLRWVAVDHVLGHLRDIVDGG